ncbi:hypothetical protein J7F03_30525 [Streptomyces sp. ISL-43]|uniref:hypothetical protein n=1 Tax=Streptomyces sp. ISL-43 TaxID=2819183 RepID=UPI001BE93B6C|nr:hypothetical protein [Streptomyces sp. ISL-43]MBT2451330.1 hypothetical protein [Streptomyces sp. ISL-43]
MHIEKQPKTWSYICIGLYVAGIAYMGVETIPEDTGIWLILSSAFLVLGLLPFLGVPISKFIYHRIRINPELGTLRVGRELIPLADLDPASVQAARAEVPLTAAERYAASLSAVDAPVPGLRAKDQGRARLVGGAWGVPAGMDTVTLANRRGEPLLIATRDRNAFLTALATATPA